MAQETKETPLEHIDAKTIANLKKNPLEPLRDKLKNVELELLTLSDKLLAHAKEVPGPTPVVHEPMPQTEEDGKVCIYIDDSHTRHVEIELEIQKPKRSLFKTPPPTKATVHLLDDVGNPAIDFSYHVGAKLREEHFNPLLQGIDQLMQDGDYFEPSHQLRIVQGVAQVIKMPDLVPAYIRRQQRRYCMQANKFVSTHLESMRQLTAKGASEIRGYLSDIEKALCNESLNSALDVVIERVEHELQTYSSAKKKEWEQQYTAKVTTLDKRAKELDKRASEQTKTNNSLKTQSDRLDKQQSIATANDQRAHLFDRYDLDALTMDRLTSIFPNYAAADYTTRIDQPLRTFYGLQLERHCMDTAEQSHALDCMHALRIACVGENPTAEDLRECYRGTRAILTYTKEAGKTIPGAICTLREKSKNSTTTAVREFAQEALGIELCLEKYDTETHHD
jgi:BMFP domain-containing protein YqiC